MMISESGNGVFAGATLGEVGPLQKFVFGGSGSGPHAATVNETFWWVFWISLAFFVLLMGLTVLWSVQYRRRGTPVAEVSASHNTILETMWTVIPLGILAVMFFKGFQGYLELAIAPAGAIEMDVRAAKWDWRIIYPNGAESTERFQLKSGKEIPIFYMPAETPVKLRMISSDVIHSFYVPDFRGKFDVMPNRYTSYTFQSGAIDSATKVEKGPLAGMPYEDHWLFCAEYCGDSHSEMAGVIRLVPREAWLKVVDGFSGAGLSPAQKGKRLHTIQCASCHSVDGTKNIGPSWKDIYGKTETFTDGSSALVDDQYIRESILEPGKKIVAGFGTQMQSFKGILGEDDIAAIIEYMKTISVHAKPADAGKADEGKKEESK